MPGSVAKSSPRGLDFYFAGLHKLMPHRVQHVLLVSSLYESFILEEEGLFTELITTEYLDLHLSHAPRVTWVSTAEEALDSIEKESVDLVITMTRLSRWNVSDFAGAAKELRPKLPVVVLGAEPRELTYYENPDHHRHIDQVFLWNGDAKILVAIIKFVEDRLNAEPDTETGDVGIILLVENSVWFYSTYLPLIYTELMKLTQSLMAEGINRIHKLVRQRVRPKILLAETFEDAWALYSRFSDNLLGVISDVRFPKQGELDRKAGLELIRRIRVDAPHLPILLQSSDGSYAQAADELRVSFLNKRSPSLLHDLRAFILGNLGFGEFVFQLPDGTEIGRASDLRSFEEAISTIPDDCLLFHAQNNHFSNWLLARTEFELAAHLRAKAVSDFPTLAEVRRYLLERLAEFRERTQSGLVADFSRQKFDLAATFTRIGTGSIGGKARGLAFINALIRPHALRHRFADVRIAVPKSAAIGTDVFDAFLDENRLRAMVSEEVDDERIAQAFQDATLPGHIYYDLAAFLRSVRYPLAIRSSSLLEDSQDRPFAGIYSTYMIPNSHDDVEVRLDQLCAAIKFVYASTFFKVAKRYLESTGHRAEEEKMGVILQELVGSQHGQRFYPTFSGVARSYNFYPAGQMAPEQGVACVALGLGKMVVEGGESLMFSPAHPRILPQFSTTAEMLANSQRSFFALDMSRPDLLPTADDEADLLRLGLDVAEEDGTLAPIASVYSPENDMVYDGLHRPGTRLVTFAHVLKSDLLPLADILRDLLEIGSEGMACPVEIEFAVDMSRKPVKFGFLQIRPIISSEEYADVCLADVDPTHAVCYSAQALGNGQINHIHDIVYVKVDGFDSSCTREIAAQLGEINEKLRESGGHCVLIGPGRWGSADRWLGIPVTWEQISCARVIVETTLDDFRVAPSQGTHFFQNITSLGIGYLAVDPTVEAGFIDWSWLAKQKAVDETQFVRRVHLAQPLAIKLDGRARRGVVFKPGHGTSGRQSAPEPPDP